MSYWINLLFDGNKLFLEIPFVVGSWITNISIRSHDIQVHNMPKFTTYKECTYTFRNC